MRFLRCPAPCVRASVHSSRRAALEDASFGPTPTIPVPMVNILSGGLHAGHNIEFQDFLVIAHGFDSYSEALACDHAGASACEART